MQVLSNNVLMLVADKLLNGGAAVFLLYLLANNLLLEEFGLYQYSLSIASIAAMTLNLVDEKVIKRNFADSAPRKILRFAAECKLLIISLIFIILNATFHFFNFDYRIYCLVSFFLVGQSVTGLASLFHVYFDYESRSDIRARASFSAQIVNLVTLIILVHYSVPLVFLALSTVLSAIMNFLVYLKFTNLIPTVDKTPPLGNSIKKKLLFESLPFGIAAISHMLYYRLDIIMVGGILDYTNVGLYSAATQIISISVLLVYPVQTALFKIFSEEYRRNRSNFFSLYTKVTRLMTCMGFGIAFGVWLSFDFIRPLFLSEEFQKLDGFLWILLFGTVLQYNASLRSSYFVLADLGVLMLYLQAVCLLMNGALNYLLIPAFGLIGASIATVLSLFFNLFLANLFHPSTRPLFRVQTMREVRNE